MLFYRGHELKYFKPNPHSESYKEKIFNAFPKTDMLMLFSSIKDAKKHITFFSNLQFDKTSQSVIFEVEIIPETVGELKDIREKSIRFQNLTTNNYLMYINNNGQIAKSDYLLVDKTTITKIISAQFFDFKFELNMNLDAFNDLTEQLNNPKKNQDSGCTLS